MPLSYADSGVDVARGDRFVERIKKIAGSGKAIGGFCGLYPRPSGGYLAASTDGVGTKVLLAHEYGHHHSIGLDVVAMCVNDLICSGARPLFFLDYLAVDQINPDVGEELIKGIVDGCEQSGMVLLGGETAEMRDLYPKDSYDVAGFAVGEVEDPIDGSLVKAGDKIVGLPSSGFHANGFSLIRKLLRAEDSTSFIEQLLAPTTIYVKPILSLLRDLPGAVKGMAHITGGGFSNLSRINPKFQFKVTGAPARSSLPAAMQEILTRSELSETDLRNVFNMGMGFGIVTEAVDKVVDYLSDEGAFIAGEVGR